MCYATEWAIIHIHTHTRTYNIYIYVHITLYIHTCIHIYIYIYICTQWERLARLAAYKHEMGIYKDMDIVYDLKMLDKEGELQTKYRKHFQNQYNRMNDEQRSKWDAYYDPIIKDFKKSGLVGSELALWKFNRYK